MSVVGSSRWSARPRPPGPNSGGTAGTSAAMMGWHGVRATELLGGAREVFRSVESVEPTRVQVQLGPRTAWLPRSMIEGDVRPGQWLRFSREGDQVRIAVDLRATLRAEARLADLFVRLS